MITLFEQLETMQTSWREDITKAFEAAVEEVGVDCFLRAVYGKAYKPLSPAVEAL